MIYVKLRGEVPRHGYEFFATKLELVQVLSIIASYRGSARELPRHLECYATPLNELVGSPDVIVDYFERPHKARSTVTVMLTNGPSIVTLDELADTWPEVT
jgi:hypothetical protein